MDSWEELSLRLPEPVGAVFSLGIATLLPSRWFDTILVDDGGLAK